MLICLQITKYLHLIECFNKSDFETFVEYYTTPKGEDVVAFGYCGYDG